MIHNNTEIDGILIETIFAQTNEHLVFGET